MRRWSLAVLALLLSAGCSDKPATSDIALDPDATTGPGVALPDGPLTAASAVGAPVWQVGDWYGHHVFLAGQDPAGEHINAVVVADAGDAYVLATDDQQMAKVEAAFDIPILGPMMKKDLATQSFGATWKIYDFPLQDNKTWQGSVTGGPDFDEQVTVDYEATFNPAIETAYGTFAGFDIVGTTSDGVTIIGTDYVPAIGWYSRFFYYDVATEDPEDWEFQSISMGYGKEWKGTFYLDTSVKVLGIDPVVAVDPSGGTPAAEPAPHTAFTVPEDADHLYGYAYAWAWMGASRLRLVDPAGATYAYDADGVGTGAGVGDEVDLPAVPGEWRAVAAHGGAASGAGAHLWAITEVTGTL